MASFTGAFVGSYVAPEGTEMSGAWTPARMRAVFEEVKNWGRWGADDELGTLRLITPAKCRDEAACVIAGEGRKPREEIAERPRAGQA
jgi:hypothetical protein